MTRQVYQTVKDVTYFDEEAALSILLEENIVFANSREYIHRKYIPDPDNKDKYKPTEEYTIEDETIVLFVNCNDIFAWACADAESFTLGEVKEVYEAWTFDNRWGVSKWCCKKRNLKPQKPVLDDMKKDGVWDDEMEKLENNPE